MVNIETPPMSEGDVRQQLKSLQSYLHRTAQQLQWAFETLEPASAGTVVLQKNQPQNGDQSLPGTPQAPSPEEIFLSLKNLIIKSADIVNAYSEKIQKKLDGTYVARSEFGTYREKASSRIEATSRGLSQLYTHQSEIARSLEALSDQTAAARAYIRTGILTEGAFPVYGLEIGQTNMLNGQEVFRKFARFTAERLSFFDSSDVEVAYISDFRLYITHAQVAGALNLGGRFQVSFDGGLAFQWTGGTA